MRAVFDSPCAADLNGNATTAQVDFPFQIVILSVLLQQTRLRLSMVDTVVAVGVRWSFESQLGSVFGQHGLPIGRKPSRPLTIP